MRLELRNFGCHRELRLELSRVNAVVGPPRSGKSTLALAFLIFFAEPGLPPEALVAAGEDEAEVRLELGEGILARAVIRRKPEPRAALEMWEHGRRLEGEEVREVLRSRFGLKDEQEARRLLSPDPGPAPRGAAPPSGRPGADSGGLRLKKAALWGLSRLRQGRCPCLDRRCPDPPSPEQVEQRAFELLEEIERIRIGQLEASRRLREELEGLLRAFGLEAGVAEDLQVLPGRIPSREDARLVEAAWRLALVRAGGAGALVLDGLEDLGKQGKARVLREAYSSGAFALLLARAEKVPLRSPRPDLRTIFLGEVRDAA